MVLRRLETEKARTSRGPLIALQKVMMKQKQNIKKIQCLANQNEVEIWSLDECHFQQHGSDVKMWVPPEKGSIVLQEPPEKALVYSGRLRYDGRLVTKFSNRLME